MALGGMGKGLEQEGVGMDTAEPRESGNIPSQARSFGGDEDTAFPKLLHLPPETGTSFIAR